ncbi:hypothetical protein C9418_12705 [Rhizobium sp. SEMIA 4032]|nr:hypothetical protein [Agrobacterium radiobacter]MBB5588665.1 hypothetical protein [Agrobacterium radiobacter]TGE89202.1 hypothetical protein C9418_12705 [Rhizobium sp. SEMIA 4032]
MREAGSKRRIDASEIASVALYALLSILAAFLIIYIVYLLVLAIIIPSTRFTPNSILPPVGATGVLLAFCVVRLHANSQTFSEFIEQTGKLVGKIWYPLLTTLLVSFILNLVALGVL